MNNYTRIALPYSIFYASFVIFISEEALIVFINLRRNINSDVIHISPRPSLLKSSVKSIAETSIFGLERESAGRARDERGIARTIVRKKWQIEKPHDREQKCGKRRPTRLRESDCKTRNTPEYPSAWSLIRP